MTTVQQVQPSELQYLAPIKGAIDMSMSFAQWGYGVAKSFVPASLKPTVESIEKTAQPYASIAQETEAKLLKTADAQVAEAVGYLQNSENAKAFTAARDSYLKYVEETIEKVKSSTKLKQVDERLASLITTLQDAVNSVRSSSWGAWQQSLQRLQGAWGQFQEHPQVKAVIGSGEQRYSQLLSTYKDAHEVVTKDARYSLLVSKGKGLLEWLQTTTPYKMVSPIVNPVASKVQSTEAYQKVTAHLAPQVDAPKNISPKIQ